MYVCMYYYKVKYVRNKIFNGQSAGLEITNGGGGVYEENEVCENKAGGICMATGCTANMKGLCILSVCCHMK